MKKFFFYRDVIGPIGNKFSLAEIIGTIAVIYNYTQNKSDLAYQANQNNVQVINNIPERGTP